MLGRFELVLSFLVVSVSAWTPPHTLFDPLVASKVYATAQKLSSPAKYPSITSQSGVWKLSPVDTWTSGFFPATLYQLKKRECLCPGSTRVKGSVPKWLQLGRSWSAGLVKLHWNNNQGHDVGFLSWPFAEDLDLSPNNGAAKTNVIDFARELASRYSPIVGATRSWNSPPNSTDFTLTGNRTFYDIAVKHADTWLKNGVRRDWGTWHVVNFNSKTGAVSSKKTRQGYDANSTWARGQSWAIYSYARLFQYTGVERYLDASRNLAAYFLRRAAENPGYLVWDFDAPRTKGIQQPADSSAAMVAAVALQLLATAEKSVRNTTGANRWISHSQKLISQTSSYAWSPHWQSLLSNGTRDNNGGGDPHARSKNTGLPYGDYFWVKSGNYILETLQAKCPSGKSPKRLSCGSDLRGSSLAGSH
ncbi:Six-hairpin glycosidase [Auriculariales sp. MPI-PUGE-AT-0066]|nr:Six-hairpin glycosidase [Auriculariales sp. MPI-PUGE-AT-0066]